MKKSVKKQLLTLTCIATIFGGAALSAHAALLYPYSLSQEERLTVYSNQSDVTYTLATNTNPTSGPHGVIISYKLSDGTVKKSALFPFYTTVGDLTEAISPGESRGVYVKPASSNETVSGVMSLNVY